MRFSRSGRIFKSTYTSWAPAVQALIATLLAAYFLFGTSTSVELHCAGGTCLFRRASLAHQRGLFGFTRGFLGSLVSEGVDKFPSSDLLHADVITVREHKSTSYRMEISLRDQRDPLKFYKFGSQGTARDYADQVNAAVAKAQKEGPSSNVQLTLMVDNWRLNELAVFGSIVWAIFAFSILSVVEVLTINRECGILVLEYKTMYIIFMQLLSKNFPVSPPSHVDLLVPLSQVRGVEQTEWVRRTDRRSETVYGIKLYLNDGQNRTLGMGRGTPNLSSNARDLEQIQQELTSPPHFNNLETLNSNAGSGGDPGGMCVICWERSSKIAFAPCAHVCCCEICGQNPQLVSCPVCQGQIQHRIGLYFS